MSSDRQFYMLRCIGPDVPTDTLYFVNGTQGTKSNPNKNFAINCLGLMAFEKVVILEVVMMGGV